MNKREEPVISQVHPYKPIQLELVHLTKKHTDTGKKRVVGIQINEPQAVPRKYVNSPMSKLDVDLEKAKKEKEDLVKELEKLENEA